ncbi:Regulatory-associated protein of mTOR [Portunus trituberculatus]|uniref:Regulatory-associated protein of mTOR n=1 Tax=Portunus trituberculatus TaxID=210409 RepID=A0A5B7DC25_PORTR|nr:Regulatory-associated protein of mTOR [Portunus trituberculatus]
MVVGGDSRTIRLWDLKAERRTSELPTGGDSSSIVTALHSHQAGPWVVAGFSDGYVRVLDRRLSSNKTVVRQWREHTSWVISAHLLNASQATTKIITGVVSGEVRLWDMRQANSVQVCAPHHEMTAMATHANAHLFATGSVEQVIGVHHASGSCVNTIKYHEGFMGTRIAPVSCLAFHPRRVLLAAGTTDTYITVYVIQRPTTFSPAIALTPTRDTHAKYCWVKQRCLTMELKEMQLKVHNTNEGTSTQDTFTIVVYVHCAGITMQVLMSVTAMTSDENLLTIKTVGTMLAVSSVVSNATGDSH